MQGLLRLYLAACVVNAHIFHHLRITGSYFDIFIPSSHAVFCFFIISGFFSFYQIDRYFSPTDRINATSYYRDRLLRIYPTYLLCIAIGAPLYLAYAPWAVDPLARSFRGWPPLLAYNLFPPAFDAGLILATGSTWKYSILPPAWSLGNEIIFYAITPFMFALVRSRPWVLLLSIGGLAAYSFGLSPAEIRYYDPLANATFFLYGAACYLGFSYLRTIVASTRLTGILVTVAMFGTLYLIRHRVGDHFSLEAYAFFSMFGAFLIATFLLGGSAKIDTAIGHISYPLFLIHVPIINTVAAYTFSPAAGYWISMLGSLAVASIIFLLFDGQMNRIRRRQHKSATPKHAGGGSTHRSSAPTTTNSLALSIAQSVSPSGAAAMRTAATLRRRADSPNCRG
jgi:peptidoglycan/LPS O-acetylase OafA/YrhL